jgi:hypothetical protein
LQVNCNDISSKEVICEIFVSEFFFSIFDGIDLGFAILVQLWRIFLRPLQSSRFTLSICGMEDVTMALSIFMFHSSDVSIGDQEGKDPVDEVYEVPYLRPRGDFKFGV